MDVPGWIGAALGTLGGIAGTLGTVKVSTITNRTAEAIKEKDRQIEQMKQEATAKAAAVIKAIPDATEMEKTEAAQQTEYHSTLRSDNQRLNERLDTAFRKIDEMREQIGKASDERISQNSKIAQLELENAEIKKQLVSMQDTNRAQQLEYQDNVQRLHDENIELTRQLMGEQARVQTLQMRLNRCTCAETAPITIEMVQNNRPPPEEDNPTQPPPMAEPPRAETRD